MDTKKVTGRQPSDERDDDNEQSMGGPVFEMTPFHKQAAALMKSAKSQKDLVAGLTQLTRKLTDRIQEIQKELGVKPFTPNEVQKLLPDATIATCRFLCDIHRAENI